MSENVVLANLVINADGTIVAYNRAGQAVTTLERTTRTSVDRMERGTKSAFEEIGLSNKRLTEGFLRTRELIRGLFLGFSVGGIVLGLAELVQSLITSTEWFKKLKESVIDLSRAIFLNEDANERFARKSADAMKAVNVRSVEAIKADMLEVLKAMAVEQQRIQEGTSDVIQVLTSRGKEFVEASVVNLEVLRKKLKELQKEMFELIQKPGKPLENLGPPKAVPWDSEFRGPQKFVDETNTRLEKQVHLLDELVDKWGSYRNVLLHANADQIRLLEKQALFNFGLEAESRLLDAVASSYVDMLSKGDQSFRAFLAAALKSLATEAVAHGLFDILLGAERLAKSYGADATGYALIKTGGEWLALGTALGLAAGALGGKQGGAGGHGTGSQGIGNSPEAPEPQRQGQVINIYMDGTFVGGQDKGAIGRWFGEALLAARRDGARI